MNYIDKHDPSWLGFQNQISQKIASKFEDLMNFNQIENLPVRIFSLMIQSDNLYIDEENQSIKLIEQYVQSVDN